VSNCTLANEVYGDAVTLTANESWNHTWSNLPEYKGGQKISYTVKELNIDSNYTATVKANGQWFYSDKYLGTVKGNIAITKVDASNPSKKLAGCRVRRVFLIKTVRHLR